MEAVQVISVVFFDKKYLLSLCAISLKSAAKIYSFIYSNKFFIKNVVYLQRDYQYTAISKFAYIAIVCNWQPNPYYIS